MGRPGRPSVLEGEKGEGRIDIPGAAGRTTHPFDLKMPCLEAIKERRALVVDTIGVPPQQLLLFEARPDVLETMVSANSISA